LRIRYNFLTLGLILVLAVGGCSKVSKKATPSPTDTALVTEQTTPTEETERIGQVVVLTEREPITLDPYRMVSPSPDDSIAVHLWDTLVWLDDDLALKPHLAESWWLVNDLTWELELRQGITFQNGEPFDARAVKSSLERAARLEGSLETFATDVALQSVEIVDDYTVRVRTTKPAVSLIYELASVEILPPIYYAQTSLEDLARNPVGSGPYQLAGWDPGGRLVLEANDDYWQGVPLVRTIVFEAENDVSQRLTRLVDGDTDLVADLPPDQSGAADTERTQLLAIESTRRLFVGLRFQEDTPLADRRVRQALNYAVDVQALVSEFHAGYGQRYGSWVNPPNADPALSPWPYDPAKARDLLSQAGYPDGFEIAMDTPVGRYYQDQEIAKAIAAQLAKVGVTTIVQPREWSVYVSERLIPKDTAPLFLLSLMSWGDGPEDMRNLAYDFPFNPTLWYNEEFEQLIGEIEQTFNSRLRQNLQLRAQAIAYDEAPWIWLWRPYLFYGASEKLDWWQPRPDGLIYLYASLGLEG